MEIVVAPSTRPGSKWMATTGDRTVHFGAAGYEDYTHTTRTQIVAARTSSGTGGERTGPGQDC